MNTEELKRLAEAATPGPWISHPKGYYGAVCRDGGQHDLVAVTYGQRRNNVLANEAYIAAANPAAVLELIAEIEQLRDQVNGLTGTADRAEKQRGELLEALKDAREMVSDWAGYASPYFQEKHDIDGDLKKLDDAIAKAEG